MPALEGACLAATTKGSSRLSMAPSHNDCNRESGASCQLYQQVCETLALLGVPSVRQVVHHRQLPLHLHPCVEKLNGWDISEVQCEDCKCMCIRMHVHFKHACMLLECHCAVTRYAMPSGRDCRVFDVRKALHDIMDP